MKFAIMRCAKLAKMGNVASSLQHAYRERETHNADPEKLNKNEHRAARSTDEAMGKMRDLLPEKRRKDAVLAVEYVFTASPEWWDTASRQDQQNFFDASHRWLAEKYGADRIFTATVHRDEKTPHLSAFVVPLTQDGRLSAKEFIGNKAQMKADQTTYAKAVEHLGLERGIEGSKATHQTIRQHYANLNQAEIRIDPSDLEPRTYAAEGLIERIGLSKRVESPEGIAERLNNMLAAVNAKAKESDLERRRASESQKTAQHLSKENQRLKEAVNGFIGGLTNDSIAKLAEFNKQLRREQEIQAKEAALNQPPRSRGRGFSR